MERFETLRASLEQHKKAFEAVADDLGHVGAGEVSEDTLRQLQGLGYGE